MKPDRKLIYHDPSKLLSIKILLNTLYFNSRYNEGLFGIFPDDMEPELIFTGLHGSHKDDKKIQL